MIRSLSLAAAALLSTGAARAQTAAPPAAVARPICDGHFAATRYSDVKPGQWATFEQAVRDHNAFYAAHGIATTVTLVRVLEADPATRAPRYSDTAAMTIAVYSDPAAATAAPHDAAYAKFIAEYQASSTLREEHRICLPALPAH